MFRIELFSKRRVLIIICLVVLLYLYVLAQQYLRSMAHSHPYLKQVKTIIQNRTIEQSSLLSKNGLPTILLWTKYFDDNPIQVMRGFQGQEGSCPYKCVYTENRYMLKDADGVGFHAKNIKNIDDIPTISRPNGQVWIFIDQEAPNRIFPVLGPVFNWTMTYRKDSDIWYPYGVLVPNKVQSSKRNGSTLRSILMKKTKLAVWVVSNCFTLSKREEFVDELRRYISVEMFGFCGDHKCQQSEGYRKCFKKFEETYKFYFSLENSLCRHYVTENFFRAMEYNIVPVIYSGASNYSFVNAPPGSYINAADFKSVKELADYLLWLDKNDEEYLKYFEWKRDFNVDQNSGPAWCHLCEKFYKNGEAAVVQWYQDVWDWYISDTEKLGKACVDSKLINFNTRPFFHFRKYFHYRNYVPELLRRFRQLF